MGTYTDSLERSKYSTGYDPNLPPDSQRSRDEQIHSAIGMLGGGLLGASAMDPALRLGAWGLSRLNSNPQNPFLRGMGRAWPGRWVGTDLSSREAESLLRRLEEINRAENERILNSNRARATEAGSDYLRFANIDDSIDSVSRIRDALTQELERQQTASRNSTTSAAYDRMTTGPSKASPNAMAEFDAAFYGSNPSEAAKIFNAKIEAERARLRAQGVPEAAIDTDPGIVELSNRRDAARGMWEQIERGTTQEPGTGLRDASTARITEPVIENGQRVGQSLYELADRLRTQGVDDALPPELRLRSSEALQEVPGATYTRPTDITAYINSLNEFIKSTDARIDIARRSSPASINEWSALQAQHKKIEQLAEQIDSTNDPVQRQALEDRLNIEQAAYDTDLENYEKKVGIDLIREQDAIAKENLQNVKDTYNIDIGKSDAFARTSDAITSNTQNAKDYPTPERVKAFQDMVGRVNRNLSRIQQDSLSNMAPNKDPVQFYKDMRARLLPGPASDAALTEFDTAFRMKFPAEADAVDKAMLEDEIVKLTSGRNPMTRAEAEGAPTQAIRTRQNAAKRYAQVLTDEFTDPASGALRRFRDMPATQPIPDSVMGLAQEFPNNTTFGLKPGEMPEAKPTTVTDPTTGAEYRLGPDGGVRTSPDLVPEVERAGNPRGETRAGKGLDRFGKGYLGRRYGGWKINPVPLEVGAGVLGAGALAYAASEPSYDKGLVTENGATFEFPEEDSFLEKTPYKYVPLTNVPWWHHLTPFETLLEKTRKSEEDFNANQRRLNLNANGLSNEHPIK